MVKQTTHLDADGAHNVRAAGVIGDGVAVDSPAIQSAIDRVAAAGGGVVRFPAGTYLCGTLVMRSNVGLWLDVGARILAAQEIGPFAEVCKTPHGNHPGQIHALLWAQGVENVTIDGPGVIDGGRPGPLTIPESTALAFRPTLVFYRDCRNVKFLNVTMTNSDMWTLHLQRCVDVMIRGVTIRNNPRRINSDGIDPDGCRNVVISDCNIVAGDDCICIKSTEGDPCENITVANCVLSTTCAALKIGTEALGPICNVTFTNCVIHDTNVALALYMKDGSTYENMIFSNMIIESSNQVSILVDNTPRYYKTPTKGRIRSIAFENIIVSSPGRCYVEGLPDAPIENLSFRNVTWNVTGPLATDNVRKPAGSRRTERDPDAVNHIARPYQLAAVNVEDLEISGFRVYDRTGESGGSAARGHFYLNNVRRAVVEKVRPIPPPAGVDPTLCVACEDVRVDLPKA